MLSYWHNILIFRLSYDLCLLFLIVCRVHVSAGEHGSIDALKGQSWHHRQL